MFINLQTPGILCCIAMYVPKILCCILQMMPPLHSIPLPPPTADFAILISTGMKWYTAFLLNFLHSLAAMVGFFVGVAVGTNSETAVDWILTATIGIFLYIALVDLVGSSSHAYFT